MALAGYRSSLLQLKAGHRRPAVSPRRVAVSRSVLVQADAPSTSGRSTIDHYQQAGQRLQNLLAGVGDGEDELVKNLLASEDADSKLQTSVVFGGAVTLGAVIVASLLGKDPWGGATLSLESLQAGAVGAAVAIPLVAFRAWSWSPGARKALPALDDMHCGQVEFQKPWLTRMTERQVLVMMALEVLPVTMLLFPAGQNALAAALGLYNTLLHSMGLSITPEQSSLVALVLVALISGLGKSMELSASEEEYEMVNTAAANADRFYRTMSSSNAYGQDDASQAADAFRLVAQAWIETKEGACAMAGVLTTLDVLVLGGLWGWTGDLTSTAVAALAINYVDVHHLHQAVLRRERKAGGSGPNPSA